MSAYHAAREELPSPSLQKRPTDDADSGFHELIDDATAFELFPPSLPRRSASPLSAQSPLQILQQASHEHHVATQFRPRANGVDSSSSAASCATTPEYSPISPSPQLLENGTGSVSSNASTQPDTGIAASSSGGLEQHVEESTISFLNGSPDPSPVGSVEDVSGKGKSTITKLKVFSY